MKTVKLFETSDWTKKHFKDVDAAFIAFLEAEILVKDGVADYEVGICADETDDPEWHRYVTELDNWLIASGAKMGERVVVNHGKWHI